MKDNQKKYLDKVVDMVVRETRIDYDDQRIYTPFIKFNNLSLPLPYTIIYFSQSHNTYGIVGDEIEYVWTKYTNIIKDKIDNER
jgi:hypothetical protein